MDAELSIFPNVSTVAFYNSEDHIITLCDINEKELLEAVIKPSYNDIKTLKVYIHEISHWKDHHTTLWGVKNLIKHYNAINARLNNDPNHFFHIPLYIIDTKLGLLTSYYHTIEDHFDVSKNRMFWKWDTSIGLRFDYRGYVNNDAPILFINFRNPYNNQRLSRTPLSVSSILETKAMAEEILSSLNYLSQSDMNSGEQEVELSIIKAEANKWLYNTELTLYSAIGHLTSCLSNRGDIVETFRFARNVSILSLTMPNHYYDVIPTNSSFDAYKDRVTKLRENRDIGFLFMNLIYNYKDSDCDKSSYIIEDLLKASKLPSLEVIKTDVLREFDKLKQLIIDGPMASVIKSKVNIATEYFEQNGFDMDGYNSLDFAKYDTPRVIYKDTYLLDSFISPDAFIKQSNITPSSISTIDWYSNMDKINTSLREFYKICGI